MELKTKVLLGIGGILIIIAFVGGIYLRGKAEKSFLEFENKKLEGKTEYLEGDVLFNFTSQDERVNTLITTEGVEISKWNRNFTWNFPDFVNVTPIENGVIINHSGRRVSILRIVDNNTFEWDFVLYQRPLLSFVAFPIGRNMNCALQQPLDVQENDFSGCNATDCWDENMTIWNHRDENVVNSYACYGDERGNQFKTGKIMHIYRPFVYDANNNSIWGRINITDNNFLILSVDRTWLDNAVYPVTIDPTFGYTSIGVSNVALSYDVAFKDQLFGLTHTAGANEQVDQVCISPNTGISTTLVAIYNMTGTGHSATAQTRVGANSGTFTSTSNVWTCVDLTRTLVEGQNYTVAGNAFGLGSLDWNYDENCDVSLWSILSRATDGDLPVTWVENSQRDYCISLYANYSIVGGDTCTYGGSGNWIVDCADNCIITDINNLGSNDLQLYGSGNFNLRARLYVDDIIKSPSCNFIGINNTVKK